MHIELRTRLVVIALIALAPAVLSAQDDTEPYLLADYGRHYLLRGNWDRAFRLLRQADAIASQGMQIPDFAVRPIGELSDARLGFGVEQVRKDDAAVFGRESRVRRCARADGIID
jgi:hypothetical protein